MRPVVLLKETPVAALAGRSQQTAGISIKDVEIARFGEHVIMVNHRASPVDISHTAVRRAVSQARGWLSWHSAVCLEIQVKDLLVEEA